MPRTFNPNLRNRDFQKWVIEYFLSNEATSADTPLALQDLLLTSSEIIQFENLVDEGLFASTLWDRYYLDLDVLYTLRGSPWSLRSVEFLFLFLLLFTIIFFLTLLWSL